MRYSLKRRVRVFIVLFLLLIVLQWAIMHTMISNATISPAPVKNDLTTVLTVFFLLQFTVGMVLFFHFPNAHRRSMNDIRGVIRDISHGSYKLDIDFRAMTSRNDEIAAVVIDDLDKMYQAVSAFDRSKKEKIVEHYQRILALLKLSEDGFIILNMDGNIRFVGEILVEMFPSLKPDVNLFEASFHPDVENTVIKYCQQIVRKRAKVDPTNYYIPSLKHHINCKCAMVRDENAQPIGAVVCVMNLIEKKKKEREKEIEENR